MWCPEKQLNKPAENAFTVKKINNGLWLKLATCKNAEQSTTNKIILDKQYLLI